MTSLAHPQAARPKVFTGFDAIDLLDWKRRIFALYEEVRASPDPEAAWNLWRDVRESLYRMHPQSPVPPARRDRYDDAFYPYDPAYRVVADVADGAPKPGTLPASTGGTFAFTRIGRAGFTLLGDAYELDLSWNEADGLLGEEYDAALARAGKVFNIVKAMSLRPAVLRESMRLYRVRILRADPAGARVARRGGLPRERLPLLNSGACRRPPCRGRP